MKSKLLQISSLLFSTLFASLGVAAETTPIAEISLTNEMLGLQVVEDRSQAPEIVFNNLDALTYFNRTPEGKANIQEEGIGKLYQNKNGAFIVFSQFPIKKIPDYNSKFLIFLVGPTPEEYGNTPADNLNLGLTATRYWRRTLLSVLNEDTRFDEKFILVLPEPASGLPGSWTETDYPGLKGGNIGKRQLSWENSMLEKAHVIFAFAWSQWTHTDESGEEVAANSMPTTRFEIGYYMGKRPEVLLAWVPETAGQMHGYEIAGSKNCGWVKTHSFIDQCSLLSAPVTLDGFKQAVDNIYTRYCDKQETPSY